MTISGTPKVFEKSQALFADGATIVASSGTGGNNALSMNKLVRWESVGSDDSTTETLTITLPSAVDIDRILLADHNLKEFTVQYGSTPTDFTNVIGLDGKILYAETVTNGDFSTWTADDPDGWTVISEVPPNIVVTEDTRGARFKTSGSILALAQDSVFVIGKTYQITVTIPEYSGTGIALQERATATAGTPVLISNITGSGTFTFTHTATKNAIYFSRILGAATNLVISEVSVKEAPVGINETLFDKDTAYYEFDSVNTDEIYITATKTQTVDAEKYINIIIPTEEIGTFSGYPPRKNVVHNPNSKKIKTQSGKYYIQRGFDSFSCSLDLNYTDAGDLAIFDELFEKDDKFLLWLCGGKYDTAKEFRVIQRGWRLQDIYQVYQSGNLSANYRSDVTTLAPKTGISVVEVI